MTTVLNNPAAEKAMLLVQANVKTKNVDILDTINLNINGKKSVEYARARAAINQRTWELFKDNAAGAKTFKHPRKKIAIEFLGGKISYEDVEKDGKTARQKFVVFPDGSKARY